MNVSSGKKNDKRRLDWLDFGKAAGIFLVLLVHTGGDFGLLSFYGGMFYMPIFFVSAGYTYQCRREEPLIEFVKKKAKRLLVPYFGTSIFLWLFFWLKDCALAGNPGDLKLLSLLGIVYSRNQMYGAGWSGENPVLLNLLNAPLWFLTAMFLTYVYYEIISRRRKKYLWLGGGLFLAVCWHYSTDLLLPWSLEAVPYFACFVAAGEWLRENGGIERLKKQWYWNVVLLVVFIVLSGINGSVNLSCGDYGNSMSLGFVAGSTGSVLVFMLGIGLEKICRPLVRAACCVGRETLSILCFHMFLFMFIRTAAGLLGLGERMTQAALVAGSAAILTAAGRFMHRKNKQ